MIIGSKHIFIENLPSTNTHASELITKTDLPEGSVVRTDYQSSGRGQAGNSWESEEGKNLLISVVIYPSFIKPADQFYISMFISLGICDFLRRYIPLCSIKWPNDIYVNSDKIAGILIENTIMEDLIQNSIAGIGLNINQTKFLSDAPNPVSLNLLTDKSYDHTICLNELCSDLDRRYKQLISEDHAGIRNDYISLLYRFNEWHNFRDINGLFSGRITGINNTGKIQIEMKTGNITEYAFKELDFIP